MTILKPRFSQSYSGAISSPQKSGANSIASSQSTLEYTPLEDIPIGVRRVVNAFHRTKKTHAIQYRLNQLRNMYFILKDNVDELANALQLDFYRNTCETKMLDIIPGLTELLHTMASLNKWAKPEALGDLPKNMVGITKVYIERIPYGTVLIISPFNYPFLLSLGPITGAIAAGNTVVFKPSESTPHFSKLFTKLLTTALDPDIFFAVNGGIPETTILLDQKFDKILYTGNNAVGTIVAKKAAETLTPYILELGGKSPAFVLKDVEDSDITTIARRIAWGRFINGGQTCVAVDYVLVHESVHSKLVKELVRIVSEEFYPKMDKDDENITHLIHDRSFNNVLKMLANTRGTIVFGGESDANTRFIQPTIIDNVYWNDSSMRLEIFGPVLPIMEYSDLDEALKHLQKRHDTPLAQYIFTSGNTSRLKNPEIDKILTFVRSGAAIINDVVVHVSLPNAPFGGIGNSGSGAYHGYYSFESFTHPRTTIEQQLWTEFTFGARYPPYNKKKENLATIAYDRYHGNLWFNRTGDVAVKGPNGLLAAWATVSGFAALLFYFAAGVS